MAEASVVSQEHEDGSISIGVKKDGVFVPIASRQGSSVASLIESGKQTAEAEKDNGKAGDS